MIELAKNCAREVFNELGYGHTESVYETALFIELMLNNVTARTQVPCPVIYKGFNVGVGYIDILLDNFLIELKAVAKSTSKDIQQVRKYLVAMDIDRGLLVNFGTDLEIVEVNRNPGFIEVPFEVDSVALKEAWEKGNHEQTPSSEG